MRLSTLVLSVFVSILSCSSLAAQNMFPANHYCNANPLTEVCGKLQTLKNPDFAQGPFAFNVYAAAHRGAWGTFTSSGGAGSGPPEGSLAALQLAAQQGLDFVEVDIMRTADNGLVVSHDYPLWRTTNDQNRDHFVFNRTENQLTSLFLKHANGKLSDQNMLNAHQLISTIKDNNLVLMLDIKERVSEFENGSCIRLCEEQYFTKVNQLKTLKLTLDVAEALNATQHVVVKTKFSPTEIQNGFTQTSPVTGNTRTESGIPLSRMQKYQWHPGLVSSRYNNNIQNIVAAVQAWPTDLVAVFETTFKNLDDVQAKSFQVGTTGPTYGSIFEYLMKVKGLRGGFFTDEVVVPKGGVDRWAKSSLKNTVTSHRSNYTFALDVTHLKYSRYGLFTTDNPQPWREFNE